MSVYIQLIGVGQDKLDTFIIHETESELANCSYGLVVFDKTYYRLDYTIERGTEYLHSVINKVCKATDNIQQNVPRAYGCKQVCINLEARMAL